MAVQIGVARPIVPMVDAWESADPDASDDTGDTLLRRRTRSRVHDRVC